MKRRSSNSKGADALRDLNSADLMLWRSRCSGVPGREEHCSQRIFGSPRPRSEFLDPAHLPQVRRAYLQKTRLRREALTEINAVDRQSSFLATLADDRIPAGSVAQ